MSTNPEKPKRRKPTKPTIKGVNTTPKALPESIQAGQSVSSTKAERAATRRDVFIEELAKGETVTDACRIAGLSRQYAYELRAGDAGFSAEWDAAIECGTDALEAEARRRAMAGSDGLIIFLLKGRRRAIFGEAVRLESKTDLTVKGEINGPADQAIFASLNQFAAIKASLGVLQDRLKENNLPFEIETQLQTDQTPELDIA
jgi:hypothetical protein